MTLPDSEAVRAVLAGVRDPSGTDLVAAGRVKGLSCKEGRVGFVIELKPGEDADAFAPVRAEAEAAVRRLAGVTRVAAVLTAHAEAPGTRRQGGQAGHAHDHAHDHHDGHDHGRGHRHDHNPGNDLGRRAPSPVQVRPRSQAAGRPAPAPATSGRLELPGVKAVVAVASGKGGVGKSTIAANLACAIARRGRKAGLLDADVYGPSAPILFGLEDARLQLDAERRVIPPQAYGVKVMSVGFIAKAEQAMIWRGPIVTSTINELLGRVNWAPLDVLVLDLPPGTGDVQITLSQRAPISGAVIVSTPQKLALADVRRGIEMFATVHVPIIGVVENMSATVHPETGSLYAPFGMDGAKIAAEALGAPFLGAFPLDPSLAFASDQGEPPAAVAPESEMGARFLALADAVLAALDAGTQKAAPEIVFE